MTVYIALDFRKQKILFASESRSELNRILLEEQTKTLDGKAVWLGKMAQETFVQISDRMLNQHETFNVAAKALGVKYGL
ncbi:hypothetical protein K1728_06035 [Weissella confusa]|uniref:hypothetical protein n=1 Tax=Weissella confusa TaxID=1583 RepID=UPI001C6FB67B|nr:hypothetical protein [Weissella confusa]QYU56753.1 hypothetical protein K1728_06035 [Weissella confusa]